MDAVSYVCANLGEIRTAFHQAGTRIDVLLDELLAAVDAGQDTVVDRSLKRLHIALQEAGDALGIYGNLPGAAVNRSLRPVGLSRQSGIGPDDVVYLCPSNTCSRYWWPQGDTAPPHCALRNQPSRQDRL